MAICVPLTARLATKGMILSAVYVADRQKESLFRSGSSPLHLLLKKKILVYYTQLFYYSEDSVEERNLNYNRAHFVVTQRPNGLCV